jgi:serine/threonine protein kinase
MSPLKGLKHWQGKLFTAEWMGKPVAVKRVYSTHEITMLRICEHASVVPLLQVVNENETLWMVMPLLDGPNLLDYAVEHAPLAPRQIAKILHGAVQALAHCHALGVAHRDIKLENLVMQNGNAVLVDFEFAGLHERRCGSPYTMAPELLNGIFEAKSCDVYALGVCLHFLAYDQDPNERQPSVKVKFEPMSAQSELELGVCISAMLGEADKRPSMRDVAKILREIKHW